VRWLEELCFRQSGRAGWLNCHNVAGGTLSGDEGPWDMVCFLENWRYVERQNFPSQFVLCPVIDFSFFGALYSRFCFGPICQAFSLLGVPQSRFLYSISESLCCK
jgi:hypothetical protein